ncbi:hypothetical protein HMPREF9372_2280 [Sporosarcina newyorkensis 2681]|uniref:Uncharacterized protein n=1 Tax=Sporosarcina newyorkensis 2681 TaxID=1027292 RepID=F9DTZ9_9BACL|nr:hypothetical protein HMPREF9372_2280 [Sporosarcina newyorkensis 2681]
MTKADKGFRHFFSCKLFIILRCKNDKVEEDTKKWRKNETK